MMPCLDEETILSFCHGSMAADSRRRVEAHIAECDECRALVSAVVSSSLAPPKELVADPAVAPTTPAEGLGSERRDAGLVSAPVRAGDLLGGKYSVERVLGAGGMGVVVAARHLQLGQLVALKFLLPAAVEAPGAIARFSREGKAAARITSEHVARVIDTGTLENGSPYLVMEYLEGVDLRALTAERKRLPASEAIEYVLQACEAIVEAHELGIVHRDLKPANLFLSHRKDGSPLVKVLDFGISRTEGASHTQLTSASVLMGSPRYMSPEQMVSAKSVDHRTDVWALGIILFELVTGEPVWHAETVQGLCAQIASAPAPRIRQLVPDAHPDLEMAVDRCLAKSPEERMPSVAALALALAQIAPPSAQTSIDRILKIARTHPSLPTRTRPASVGSGHAAAVVPAADVRTAASSRRKPVVFAVAGGALVLAAVFVWHLASRWQVEPRHARAVSASSAAPPTPLSSSLTATDVSPSTPAATATDIPSSTPPSASIIAPPVASARTAPSRPPPTRTRPEARTNLAGASTGTSLPSAPVPSSPETPNRALTERK
jgi:serine/threonine-protein kinase